jgi:hypothetical protein
MISIEQTSIDTEPRIALGKFKENYELTDVVRVPFDEDDREIIKTYFQTNLENENFIKSVDFHNTCEELGQLTGEEKTWAVINFSHWPNTYKCQEFRKSILRSDLKLKLSIKENDYTFFWAAVALPSKNPDFNPDKIFEVENSDKLKSAFKGAEPLIEKLAKGAQNQQIAVKIEENGVSENGNVEYKIHFENTELSLEKAFEESMKLFWELANAEKN